jgi:cellulose synthase/poly-beta-1,6-N-acetylglucosamine synthase-like glycosyltransferase
LTDTPDHTGDAPRVSVVLAARDEAKHLPATLAALAVQTHAELEVVIVDDRSTDATGAIADKAAASGRRVQAIHVAALPDGWLGKNNALHVGAAGADGEILLFTDADVRLHPRAIAKAVAVMSADELDHLSVLPTITSPSRGVRWHVGAFAIFFLLFTRAWRVARADSDASIGIGAFNMVRAGLYRAAGGHTRIRLRPDDDLMLGRILKQHGGRAGVRMSGNMVNVDWYGSLRELVKGVEKNTFAALDYRVSAALVSTAALALHATYFLVPVLVDGWGRWLAIVDVLTLLIAGAVAAPSIGQAPACTLLQPVTALLFAGVQARATLLTLVRGGIFWRGTFYPLAELRRNQVPRTGR